MYGRDRICRLYELMLIPKPLDNGHPSLYIDGDVHNLDLISTSLHVTDRRHPQYVSATKLHRIVEICKGFHEKWYYPMKSSTISSTV